MNYSLKAGIFTALLMAQIATTFATSVSNFQDQPATPNQNEKVTVSLIDFLQNDALMFTFAGITTNGGLTTPMMYSTTFDTFVSDLTNASSVLSSDTGSNFTVTKVGSTVEFTAKSFNSSVNNIGSIPTDADEFDGFNPSISKVTTPQVAGNKQVNTLTFIGITPSDTIEITIDGLKYSFVTNSGTNSADITAGLSSLINGSGSSTVLAGGLGQLVLTGKTSGASVTLSTNIVPDTTAPTINLLGSGSVTLTVGDAYVDTSATASDNIDGDITANIATGGTFVDTSATGTYTITYNVSDIAGNPATQVTRNITVNPVPDTTKPTATISYSTTGATNQDVIATLTGASEPITITSTGGNTHTFSSNGSFTFDFVDGAGNTGSTIATVANIDKQAPVITLSGTSTISLTVGGTYNDAGATWLDNVDGTGTITASGLVNTGVVGTYTLSYYKTDVVGNIATPVTRTVTVTAVVVSSSGGGGGGSSSSSSSSTTTSNTTTTTPVVTSTPIVTPNSEIKITLPKLTKGINAILDTSIRTFISNPTIEAKGGFTFAIGTTSNTPVKLNKRTTITVPTSLPNGTKVKVVIANGKMKPKVADGVVKNGKITFGTTRTGVFTVTKK